MSAVHYLSNPDALGCNRAIALGTEHTCDKHAVTCGNCKRSKAFKGAPNAETTARQAKTDEITARLDAMKIREDEVREQFRAQRAEEDTHAVKFSEQPALMARIRKIAEDAESARPFRTSGKVKNTRQARRYRKGA